MSIPTENKIDKNAEHDPVAFHQTLPNYQTTPLVTLPELAEGLRVGGIYVKDESHRFDLGAFKVLGASYAIYRWLKEKCESEITGSFSPKQFLELKQKKQISPIEPVCTATDGNHGRAVAWTAKLLGLKAVIYMPCNSVEARIENICKEGAEVVIVDGTYDDAVEQVKTDAKRNGWQIISDTSWPGYTEIPVWIQQGYATLYDEIDTQLTSLSLPCPTIFFVQGGVGALAAATVQHFSALPSDKRPTIVCVEPTSAACMLESSRSKDGEPKTVTVSLDSMMAGLNCGKPSMIAWSIIKKGVDAFVSISDEYAVQAMRKQFYSVGGDTRIVSGESGAAGMGALLALLQSESMAEAKKHLNLGLDSRVLLLNTEGATDPVNFERVVETKLNI